MKKTKQNSDSKGPKKRRYHIGCYILNETCRVIIFIPDIEQR